MKRVMMLSSGSRLAARSEETVDSLLGSVGQRCHETSVSGLLATYARAMSVTAPVVAIVVSVLLSGLVSPVSALAASAAPGFTISAVPQPTNFSAGRNAECKKILETFHGHLRGLSSMKCDRYMVTVRNEGSEATNGGTIRISDFLPKGLKAVSIGKGASEASEVSAPNLTCELATVSCTPSEALALAPGGALVMVVDVEVLPGASASLTNTATVSGAGAPEAATSSETTVSATRPAFGVNSFGFEALGVDGAVDAQAGDHPNAVTASFQFPTVAFPEGEVERYLPVEDVKDIAVDLPPGFIGDPLATPQCPAYLLSGSACPTSSRVGTIGIEAEGDGSSGIEEQPIFNMVPEGGSPAEFGFEYLGREFVLYANVIPTSAGYEVRVTTPGVPRLTGTLEITGVTLTFFGSPALHDGGATLPTALFTNPTDCSAEPLKAKISVDSWQKPGVYVSKEATVYSKIDGCNALRFQPSLAVGPETAAADTPSAYEVNLPAQQAPNVFPVLATPELRNAVVTLPEGVSVSPSAADGLVGCQEAGPNGIDIPHGGLPPNQAGEGEAIGADGLSHLAAGHCPKASTLGTGEITTPLLLKALRGHLYLAQPKCGGEGQPPCTEASATNGELYGVYLEAGAEEGEVEEAGVVIKLKGSVSANQSTGQLTTTFKENPQFPFSDLKVHLNGGDRAPLANPQTCGPFTTTTDLTPWGAPVTPDATPSSSFSITGCGSAMPFAPSFSAGVVTANAATSSLFTLTFSRHDGEQNFSAISVSTPPGLVGMLSQVPLCEEPQAAQGTCSEASRIGTTTVATGAGSHPFWISGKVYLTGPYNGAPFGLSVVVPAKAGPFNLGNVIVRSAINVDLKTSALTVTSSPLPQIKDGVPFRLKTVNVTIDRPGFMLNPTNCEQQSIKGTIAAAQGATASVSSPFAVGGCKNLPFKPSFTATTQAKTSKANGASLDVKVSYPPSGKANIKSVKVDLPVQLPSRLTTLQKACVAAVFESNPARCPAESIVGIAKAQTPVLPVTLTGPAYLVSHAAAAFPDLVVILQGEGVRVDLTGNTLIKKGVTSSTFASIPDVPVSSFELYLPQGKYSALAAYGNLCAPTTTVTKRVRVTHYVHGRVRHVLKTVTRTVAQPLTMPTQITGQNGAVIKQTTAIKVTGCPNARKAATKKAKKATKSTRRRG
jgi:hypothetical protein